MKGEGRGLNRRVGSVSKVHNKLGRSGRAAPQGLPDLTTGTMSFHTREGDPPSEGITDELERGISPGFGINVRSMGLKTAFTGPAS